MAFATCRGCGRDFTKDGWGARSEHSPRLCKDCEAREEGHHPHHSKGVTCLKQYIGKA